MRLTIEKNRLLDTVAVVSKGMATRSTMPILAGIHIDAASDGVVFQATDMEISVRHITEALIEQQGAVVVPGKLMTEIVKSLPEAAVTLESGEGSLRISCMDALFSVTTMDPVDFPSFPQIITSRSVLLPSKVMSALIRKVAKAVSKDESRAVLTGILFRVEGRTVQMVATDSYRLAIAKAEVEEELSDPFELIVPGTVFDEVSRLVAEDNITIGEAENQIVFQFGPTTFISRKIEGSYPNFEQIVPAEKSMSATVETELLRGAVKRVSILAQDHIPIKLAFDSVAQSITITANKLDVGDAREAVLAQIEGDELEIGFNHQYFLDGLNAVESDEVLFEAQNAMKPGILKAVGGEYFFYLTMPVRLER